MTLPKNKSAVAASSPALKKSAVVASRKVSPTKPVVAKKAPPIEEPSPAKGIEKVGKKEKRIRATISMTEAQFDALAELRERCLRFGISAKKGEVLAAGIQLLRNLSETSFEATILPCLRSHQKVNNGKVRQK